VIRRARSTAFAGLAAAGGTVRQREPGGPPSRCAGSSPDRFSRLETVMHAYPAVRRALPP